MKKFYIYIVIFFSISVMLSAKDSITEHTNNRNSEILIITLISIISVFLIALSYRFYKYKLKKEQEICDLKLKINEKDEVINKYQNELEILIASRTSELVVYIRKLEEKDSQKNHFLTNISHEIRNPLNSIIGFSDLLRLSDIKDEEKEKYSAEIQKSSHKLLQTINDIIRLSTLLSNEASVDIVKIDIYEIFYKLREQYFLRYKEKLQNITLDFHYGSKEGIYCNSDYTKLVSIFDQLVDNAFKFSEKGTVEIGYNIENDKPNFIRFYVKDSGIGITDSQQLIIFEPFVQNEGERSRNYEGPGIGLALAKATVEFLGGAIGLKSKLGEGSEFFFYLPVNNNVLNNKVV